MSVSIGISTDAVLEMSGRRVPVKISNIERRFGEATEITVVADINLNVVENRRIVDIERVIFNPPATIVIWEDGTKTVVKCQPDDTYSEETGLALCIAKKYLGNKSNFNNIFKKYIEKEI